MIYLFNKIFLKPAVSVAETPNMIFVSDAMVNKLPTDPFFQAIFAREAGQVHLAFKSYGELLTHFGDLSSFFDYLANWKEDEQLTIYADNEAYYAILMMWLKMMLPSASSEVAYNVVYMTFKRLEYLFAMHDHPQHHLSTTDRAIYKEVSKLLPVKSHFEDAWADVPLYTGSVGRSYFSVRGGLEFLVAAALVDAQLVADTTLEAKLITMVKKQHVRYMLEVRENVLMHADLLPGYDFSTQTLDDWVALQHPGYQFLTDPNFLPDNLSYIEQHYDVDQLHDAFWSIVSANGYTVGAFLHEMLNVFKITTLKQVLDMELNYTKWRVFLGRWRYSATTNNYILEYALECARRNDVLTLKQLSPL